MSKNEIEEIILLNSKSIRKNKNFFSAVSELYKNDSEQRINQPTFYKYVLNESRFNIILITCCFIFTQRISSLKSIKEFCQTNLISSQNTIIAIISLLRVSGRIEAIRDESDGRNIKLEITEKGMKDLTVYISAMVSPLKKLYPEYNFDFEEIEKKSFLSEFFYGISVPLLNGVTYKKINTEIDYYIDKDGGRSLLLYLYIKSEQSNGTIKYTTNELACEFSVSRTQIKRLLDKLNEFGNFKRYDKNNIETTSSFKKLIEDYLSIYFSYIEFYIFTSADLRRNLISH
ncbi:MarR family transcriptional regulator [Pectobacterium colocasium]|uniref:MarR family transcriptional regulator n=1 Tax=Pectobacterium colocasium TaxID=2878098 RepID=UPI001CD4D6BF|nr:MarR family transcriptional regulator [Pectobacterium colocasium]